MLIFKFIRKFLYKPASERWSLPSPQPPLHTYHVEYHMLLITKMSRNSGVWLLGLGNEKHLPSL